MIIQSKLFPIVLIIINTIASIVWYCYGDVRKGTYFAAAAILNICVTF